MASPQLEDGFTRIANEILEAVISVPFTATQLKIILLLFRRSYGFNRKNCQLSISYIEKATGLSSRGIRSELIALIKANVLTVTQEPTFNVSREFSFQKDYTKWNITPQENYSSTGEPQFHRGTTVPLTEEPQFPSTEEPQFPSTEEPQFPQERKKYKEILNKKERKDWKPVPPDGEASSPFIYQDIVDLFNSICISYPKVTKLSEDRRKAIKVRLKQYAPEDFRRLFEKAEGSSFLKGSNNRNWTATFDWLIKDANIAKVLDGNYDSGTGSIPSQKERNYDEPW